jgi:hypothetical protein
LASAPQRGSIHQSLSETALSRNSFSPEEKPVMNRLCCAVLWVALSCSGGLSNVPLPLGNGPNIGVDGSVDTADAGTALTTDAGLIPVDGGVSIPVNDAGTPPLLGEPIIVAVGKMNRRTISCDDGKSWILDTSVDDNARCFTNGLDCDHHEFSSTSLSFVGDAFLQSTGWGKPGHIFRSVDGKTWTDVDQGLNTQDLMFGNGLVIAASRATRVSKDLGKRFEKGSEIELSAAGATIYNIRGGVFDPSGTGFFVVTAQDGTNFDFQHSADNGKTWAQSRMKSGGAISECKSGHPTAGKGLVVLVPNNGNQACVSDDHGATWSRHAIDNAENVESNTVFANGQFMAWSNGKVHRSSDGVTWKTEATLTRVREQLMPGPNPGVVAVSPSGQTFVAVRGGWQTWYDKQHFYRSTDGVTWDELEDDTFKKSHPITAIRYGRLPSGVVCGK